MCLLYLLGDPDEGRLAAAFADMFALPVESVDVRGYEVIERNWEAPVLCTVTPLNGVFPQHLDIYLAEGAGAKPSTEVLAAGLAERLGCAVGYDMGLEHAPDYYWFVGTDGERARADVSEDDVGEDEPSFMRMVAVEHPIAGAPGLPIAPIPWIITNGYRMPTPLSSELYDHLRDTPGAQQVAGHLFDWERMVTRLERGWPPDGWYPPDYYREGLESRDGLVVGAATVPDSLRAGFDRAVTELDRRFTEATGDDGGQALIARTGPIPDGWWWRRITEPPPWQTMPGGH